MTLWVRQGTAPIEEGDDLDPSEIEAEIESARAVVNGGIQNENIAADAAIAGSKLADDDVTPDQVSAAVMNKAAVLTDNTASSLPSSSSFTDVPVFSAGVSVTPGSTNDFLFMDWTVTLNLATATLGYHFGFSVGGVETDSLAYIINSTSDSRIAVVTVSWAEQASSTSATVIKPIYKTTGSTTAAALYPVYHVLRASALAIK